MYHTEFPLDDEIVHLNHAAVGPWPRRTAIAVEQFATENMRYSSHRQARWLTVENSLREQCRQLLNAESPGCIALVKNTSEALSFVAYGMDWRHGDEVVCAAEEFPSNRVVWQSLEPRFGVITRLVNLTGASDPEGALLAACTPRTRLLSVSSVQYASGLRMDLPRLGAECRRRGIVFCVDGIQSLGAQPMDVQACHADFVAADGHKWLLAPEGIGVFYCRSEWLERLTLNQYGWRMLEHRLDFDRLDWSVSKDARRFECGSPNMLGIHALQASLGLLLEVGIEVVASRIADNLSYLQQALDQLGATTMTPRQAERRAGIVNFQPPHGSAQDLQLALTRAGVMCAYRGGGIRWSPHFYTDERRMAHAVKTLEKLLGR